MHDTGTLVAEPPGACSTVDPYASPPQSQPRFDTAQAAYSHDTIEKVKQTVLARLTSASAAQLASLLEEYDTDLPNILDQPDVEAIEALVRCRRIGPKTAEKLKAQWDASAPEQGGAKTKFGTRIADLEGSPPSTPFEWTGDTKCYLPRLYAAEVGVASGAAAKASLAKPPSASRTSKIRQWILDNQDTNGLELSDGQRAAIEAASDAPILVITGGPGCGKTTVVQSIVKLWCAQGKEVKVCAPTGRAAQRMGVIQNIEPSTIHRLLKYQPRGMKGGAASTVAEDDALEGEETGFFQHGPFNRLKCDAVLVDEASMLSLPLAASLLQALRPKSQLVLVGDIDQLPPVGPGGVLHSLIASKLVPVIDLREIFRQAARSTIITSALAVRQGAVPRLPEVEPTANQLLHAGTDALLVRAPTADAVPDLVFASVAAMAGADDFKESDLQVITPMRKGPIGAGALNPRLQALLNPPGPGKAEVVRGGSHQDRVFRVGDRVLQLKNNYDKDVFNGDQGRIVRADPKMKRLVVEYPVTAGREGPDGKVTLTGDTVSKEYMVSYSDLS